MSWCLIQNIYVYLHSFFPAWAFVACDPTWWYMMSLVMWRNVTGVLVSPFVGLEIADGLGIAFAWMQLTCCGGHRFAMPAKMHQTSGCKPSPTRDVGVQILNLAHRFSIPCELLDVQNFFQRSPNKNGCQGSQQGFSLVVTLFSEATYFLYVSHLLWGKLSNRAHWESVVMMYTS